MSQNKQEAKALGGWSVMYKVAGVSAFGVVAVGVMDIVMMMLPGGAIEPRELTVVDWYKALDQHSFMAMRNLGLFNYFNSLLAIPLYIALNHTLRHTSKPLATLASILCFIGAAVYMSENTLFSMLELSKRYKTSHTAADKALLEMLGKATLALGEDVTLATVVGFTINGVAAILMAMAMWSNDVYGKTVAGLGVVGSVCLTAFIVAVSFVPSLFKPLMVCAMVGAFCILPWHAIIGIRLFRLSNADKPKVS